MKTKKKIVIIGGGSSAMFVALMLDNNRYDIQLYEQNSNLGQKFLVAGYRGLNLSFNEVWTKMFKRYTPSSFIKKYISTFDKDSLVGFFKQLGIETYVGSSGRIFPDPSFKPNDVLQAIKNKLAERSISIHYNYRWIDFKEKGLSFTVDEQLKYVEADYYIWALGGASWKKTGSDGKWINIFKKNNIDINLFQASNCAFGIQWKDDFIKTYEGKYLKNIALSCDGMESSGEVTISKFGLEGNAIYALSPKIREGLNNFGEVSLYIDLKPMFTVKEVENKLHLIPDSMSMSQGLFSILKLSKTMIALLKNYSTKACFQNKLDLAKKIKSLQLVVSEMGPLDEAISTVGGVSLQAINENLTLKNKPNHFVIGEMLDWDAPTGGYLIQGCFSMAAYVAQCLNQSENGR